jgi:hypothetical protein
MALSFCVFFASAKTPPFMRFNREAITQALAAIPGNFEMRLYVDGDFANMQDVDFWMINWQPQIKAYGYSKALRCCWLYNLVNAA